MKKMKKALLAVPVVLALASSAAVLTACGGKKEMKFNQTANVKTEMENVVDGLFENVYNLANPNPDGKKNVYTASDLKIKGTEDAVAYYVNVGSLQNCDDVTSIELGGTTFNKEQVVSVSIGNSNFVEDVAYNYTNGNLMIAAPVLAMETATSATLKINDKSFTLSITAQTSGAFNNVAFVDNSHTWETDNDGVYNITVENPKVALGLYYDDATADDQVLTKKIKTNSEGTTTGYGLTKTENSANYPLALYLTNWTADVNGVNESYYDSDWSYTAYIKDHGVMNAKLHVDVAEEVVKEVGTYNDLVNALNSYATRIVLTDDIDVASQLVVTRKIVLDLAGHKLSNTTDLWNINEDFSSWSLISVQEKGELTITGEGTVDAKENDCYAIDLRSEDAKLVIENGTFIGNISTIYVNRGSAEIYGGHFSLKQEDAKKGKEFMLNLYDENGKNGTATIKVYGGSFNGFNPADNLAEDPQVNFVAEDYVAVEDGEGNYVVTAAVAEVGTFDSLVEALEGYSPKIILTSDIDVTEQLVVNRKVTLDLNGKTLSNTTDIWDKDGDTSSWSFISVRENGDLVITGNGKIDAKENDCYAIDVRDENAKVVIENGTFIGNAHAVYVLKGLVQIKGGSFSLKQISLGYVINLFDANGKAGTAVLEVSGGSFGNNFNPADNGAEGEHTNFVVDGYTVTENDGVYTVVAETPAE